MQAYCPYFKQVMLQLNCILGYPDPRSTSFLSILSTWPQPHDIVDPTLPLFSCVDVSTFYCSPGLVASFPCLPHTSKQSERHFACLCRNDEATGLNYFVLVIMFCTSLVPRPCFVWLHLHSCNRIKLGPRNEASSVPLYS